PLGVGGEVSQFQGFVAGREGPDRLPEPHVVGGRVDLVPRVGADLQCPPLLIGADVVVTENHTRTLPPRAGRPPAFPESPDRSTSPPGRSSSPAGPRPRTIGWSSPGTTSAPISGNGPA